MNIRFDPLAGWVFDVDGEVRAIREPDGLPSGRQLLWLCAHGLLDLRNEPGTPITKLAAARRIDQAKEGEA